MNNSIYLLSDNEYQEMLDSGVAAKLIKDYPKNINIFRTERNKFIANQEVFELILTIADCTGADPSDLYDFFEDNCERIKTDVCWFESDLLDKKMIIERLEEEID